MSVSPNSLTAILRSSQMKVEKFIYAYLFI